MSEERMAMRGDGLLLRVEDAQRVLGVSRWKVYEMIRHRELPVLRIGRLVRIPRPALEAWVTANTTGNGEAA